MALPDGFLWLVFGYMATGVVVLIIIAFLQRGFMGPWMRVKGSRGKLVLVRVFSMSGAYFRTGSINDGMLFYKDRLQEQRILTMDSRGLYDMFGVKCLDTDDRTNAIFLPEKFEAVNGYDAKQYDALYQRILLRPGKTSTLLTVIVIILCVVALVCIANAYMNYKMYSMIVELGKVSSQAISTTPL